LIASIELTFDVFKLSLYIVCSYLALDFYAHRVQTKWLLKLTARRFVVLSLMTLLIIGIKVFEDVIAKESGPVDTAVLWFIRQNIPLALTGFFSLVTLTGAGIFLVPATVVLTVGFLTFKHRHEALLLASSMACAALLTYFIKALVNRSRPELWSTQWYSGSSFPSGHTLSTAAFATALALGVTRICPRLRYAAAPLAALWIGLMAVSRLVLGVHWPTDVLAAICLGVFVPLAIGTALDLYQQGLASS
jgi:undecaprenyl-diphosphatase